MPLLWQNQIKDLGIEGLDFVSVFPVLMIVYTDDTLMITDDTDKSKNSLSMK